MSTEYEHYCDHCCQNFTSVQVANRHLYQMQITANFMLGSKGLELEIKRDPETSVFTCIWSSCGAVFCDSETAKLHVTHCSERPKGLIPARE